MNTKKNTNSINSEHQDKITPKGVDSYVELLGSEATEEDRLFENALATTGIILSETHPSFSSLEEFRKFMDSRKKQK